MLTSLEAWSHLGMHVPAFTAHSFSVRGTADRVDRDIRHGNTADAASRGYWMEGPCTPDSRTDSQPSHALT